MNGEMILIFFILAVTVIAILIARPVPFFRRFASNIRKRCLEKAPAEQEAQKDDLIPLLLPSMIGIFICTVCICSMTWAWYTASVEAPAQKMTAAYYEVAVDSVTKPDGGGVKPADGGKYRLEAGMSYTVTLKASGSVKECGGHCLIQNTETGEKVYTRTFKPGETITVQLTVPETGEYTFTGVWGSLPAGTKDFLTGQAPNGASFDAGDTSQVQSGGYFA